MQLGMIGLGRMGANMTTRLLQGGHQVVVYDRSAEAVEQASEGGATGARSLADVVDKLETPRAVWVMVPSGEPTEETVQELAGLLSSDDTVIDGGNSNYKDTVRRGRQLAERGLHFVDSAPAAGSGD